MSRTLLRMLEPAPPLRIVANQSWGEDALVRSRPGTTLPETRAAVSLNGPGWRLLEIGVAAVSYAVFGCACLMMTGPFALIAALHYWPPF